MAWTWEIPRRIATGGELKHASCAPLLLAAGAEVKEAWLPTGDDALDQMLRAHFARG